MQEGEEGGWADLRASNLADESGALLDRKERVP